MSKNSRDHNTMKCSKTALYRSFDMVFLGLVFLFQNVMINYIIIWHHSASIFSFLWFLGDFFCLVLFSFAVFMSHNYHRKVKLRERRSTSRASYHSGGPRSTTPQGSQISDESGFLAVNRMLGSTKLPMTYMSWLFYAFLLTMKITVLFKTNIAQNLHADDALGPQMLKFLLGLSTIIFSLLVESHHNAINDPLRNSYLTSLAFGVALEILDSVSFLSLLIPSQGHLSYTYNMENYVIALSSINIMLPAITIYKISASNFGRAYNVPLEAIYKVLHLVLVNAPFLALRIYLWRMFSTDTAIFMIKNIYAIISFLRGIYPDLKLLRQLLVQRIQLKNITPTKPSGKGSPGHTPTPSSSVSKYVPGSETLPDVQVLYQNENNSSDDLSLSSGSRLHLKMVPSVSIEDPANVTVNFK